MGKEIDKNIEGLFLMVLYKGKYILFLYYFLVFDKKIYFLEVVNILFLRKFLVFV